MQTIRQLREAKGWARLRLANAIGVTPGTIYNWENGIGEPTASKLRLLAQTFEVSMDDIALVEPREGKEAA